MRSSAAVGFTAFGCTASGCTAFGLLVACAGGFDFVGGFGLGTGRSSVVVSDNMLVFWAEVAKESWLLSNFVYGSD